MSASGPKRAGCAALAAALVLSCASPARESETADFANPRVPAWELAPPPAREGAVVDASLLHRAVLRNGLRVLVLEDRRLPRVSLGIALGSGFGSVSPERAGLAEFTSELMARGAGDRDALALAEAVEELGASFAVSSGWDSTTVSIAGLSRDLDRFFEILADVVRHPRFDSAEAAKVRSDQLAGLEKAKDSPRRLASIHFARALYAGHRYGLPGGGTREAVAALRARDAREFHARIAVPANAIFFATGDVGGADILERVEAAFGDWPSGPRPSPGPPPPDPAPQARRVVIVDRPDLGQAQIAIGHGGIARRDPSRLAAQLANVVLGGGGFSSRLMTRLRAEEGLTYGIYSYFSLRRQPGPFVSSTATRVAEARRVVDMLLAEMERLRDEPPTPEEFANAQSLSTGRFALGLQTSRAVTNSLVDLEIHGLPEDSLDTYRSRIAALGREDVAAAARRLIQPERAAIVVVGPAQVLRSQLEGLGPLEVVEP